jgi:gliding motility-associated lipoprotein GldK
MFYSDGTLKTNFLHYRYSWVNYDEAILQRNKFDVATSRYPAGASVRVDTSWVSEEDGGIYDSTIIRPLREPKDLITSKIICVYPDTLVWIRDFQYSFNDPMMHKYFSHPGYSDYPVVGITWEQAHAFCDWRTKFFNAHSKYGAQDYRLPTEAQWEYAARGGRKMAMYPWGGNYARDAKGCFFANFKPYRGGYNDDTGTTTMKVAQFRPNDFGLFDMGGNVAEWTCSAFLNSSNTVVHDLNPDYEYMARKNDPDNLKRKVVKGGSWKDISYYMQCGVRTYEYQYESRPYIGFRCVRAYIGD